MIQKRKLIRTKRMCELLGISRQTMWTWEKEGRFSPPRIGTRGDRRFTEAQAREIMKAFGPGGKRIWHFKPDHQ